MQGLALLRQYEQMFTFVYQSPFQLLCIVHICEALVRYSDEEEKISDTVSFCLESLQTAKASYPIAGPLQKMFCLGLAEYGVPISDELENLIAPLSQYGPEEILEAITRLSYRIPISQLQPNMHRTLAEDFVRKRRQLGDGHPHTSELSEDAWEKGSRRIQVESLLNR